MAMRAGSKAQPDQAAFDGENVLKNYRPSSSKRVTIGTTGKGSGLARVNAFFGNTGTSKSSELASAGYLNLKYKALLERFGCPKTVKVLQKGILPEIEKIGIIDTDLKWIIDMEQGDWKAKYGPLVENKVFQLDEFQITRPTEVKQGKNIVMEETGTEDEKREIESAIINNLKDSSINLLGIDSMSDYIKILDDKLDIMFWDNPKAFNEGDVEGLKQMKMVLYGKRAKWFFNMLSAIRISRKPTLLTFQIAEVPSNYVKKRQADESLFDPLFENPTYNVKWVPLTGYKLDNVYYTMKDYSSNVFKVQWKKGPWSVAKTVIDIPNDPFGYCHIIENHADGLLSETDVDKVSKGEKFW